MGEADRGRIRERCSTVSFGFCAPALLGTICRVVILPTKLVIAASSSGSALGCSLNCRAPFFAELKLASTRSNPASASAQSLPPVSAAVGPTRRGKGSKIMAISDGHGLPLAVYVVSASPHETKLVEPTIERQFLAETPERLIGDRA